MAEKIRLAINGLGRIGRSVFRLAFDHPDFDIIAINDLADAKTLAHLLKYDSIHGVFDKEIHAEGDSIYVNDEKILITNTKDLADLNWRELDIDIVVEATGQHKTEKELEQHLSAGAQKVLLTVPSSDDSVKMIVLGVNDHLIEKDDRILSNASCTTNNAAPMLQVIHQHLGVKHAYISTVHSFTSDQSLHDKPHRDLRRARAATQSIIPTTTGAAKALTKIFPELSDVIGGCGIRVPVPNGSLTDMTLNIKTKTSIEEINQLFKNASENELKGILKYTEDPIVSVDIIGSSYSCTFDAGMTSVIDGDLIKLIGWYDNERGYSNRLIDLMLRMST